MYPEIRLKPERSISIINRHPWIFSGAIKAIPEGVANGSIVNVTDESGDFVATGSYSTHSLIAVRVFDFHRIIIDKGWLKGRIHEAHDRRQLLGLGVDDTTTGYRVVFGESDWLPGLVIDRYADVLVIQLATAGMAHLRDMIVECLVDLFAPRSIFERSDLPGRREEGLKADTGLRYGENSGLVEFREYGRKYLADVASGQKTGFYLDQRDLRQEVYRLASGKRTIDLFSYTGAAGTAALAGKASSVHFVDASETALQFCRRHVELNELDGGCATTESADAFQWLAERCSPEYDLVMLDPPALIKSRKHIESGRKGYHFLNRAAIRIIRDGGILVTSSCSAYFPESDLAVTLRRAAEQTGVRLSLLKIIHQASDHPRSLNFPEASYLKSFICRIER